jgi:HK97 family phage prohead protease
MNTDSTNNGKMETKKFNFEYKRLNDKDDDEYFYFSGKLSTYNDIDSDDDYFVPGAFDESLKNIPPQLLWMHEEKKMLGIWDSILSDDSGLNVVGKLPKEDTFVSGHVIPQMKIGSLRSLSVGYHATKYSYEDIDNRVVRRIEEAVLVEGSVVGRPANKNSVVTDFKSYKYDELKEIKTKREFEKVLRDSGAFSKRGAAYLASMLKTPVDIEQKHLRDSEASKISTELANEFKNISNLMKEF